MRDLGHPELLVIRGEGRILFVFVAYFAEARGIEYDD